jgi:hypothetical protein
MKSTIFFHAGFLLSLFFDPEGGGDVPPKGRLTLNGLHGVISQKRVGYPSQVRVTLRPKGSRSVSLGVEPHLGLMTRS